MTPQKLALLCAKIAEDNKAKEIVILHMTKLMAITDYFVICSGTTDRHLQGIAEEIRQQLKQQEIKGFSIEGYTEGKWILMDLGDVVVHLCLEDVRAYYELEELWGDAPRREFVDGKLVDRQHANREANS
jgi:ribosome-associated protein